MRPSPILQVLKYKHLRLTTKDVNKGFYKGNRTGAMGRHTKFGGYVIEWHKVRTYVVPEGLNSTKPCLMLRASQENGGQGEIFADISRLFKLTPFVSDTIRPLKGTYPSKEGPRDPQLYLDTWKQQNGVD
ncbi:hypothetical protein CSUB01_01962 [Colletotrichum sublineola]|uniref:50S ribosomal protein YmL27 n=1 Tax=Colletotrichum sublineola TaxID=1173701 RepID=A0A066XBC1_COLSU|nr:hypothetical protein CSUB01_01962 [Colletotrichum sublineola]